MADYKLPSQPNTLFQMPFANEGDKIVIPPESAAAGRATLKDGFPAETQLPQNEGGIAPNRLDFQGILNMLSAFACWQQSGGMFSYNQQLSYQKPSVVFYNNMLWWCEQANGPDTSAGLKLPGTDTNYWTDFLTFLAKSIGGIDATPVGIISPYYGVNAPDGYLACNGTTFSATTYPKLYAILGNSNRTPDMRGLFVRGYDTRNTVDPQGASRAIGSVQQDALQNIKWDINSGSAAAGNLFPTQQSTGGPFDKYDGLFHLWTGQRSFSYGGDFCYWASLGIDVSRLEGMRTATETRSKNINLLWCIKHD